MKPSHFFAGNTDGRALLDKSSLDGHPDHDGIPGVEDTVGEDAEFAGEDSDVLELFLFLFLQLGAVIGEGIKQVVDDVGGEDPYPESVRHLLSLTLHFHVKCQNNSVSEVEDMFRY